MSEAMSIFNRLNGLRYSSSPAATLPRRSVAKIVKRIDAENQKEFSRTITKPDPIKTHHANHCP